MKKADFDFDLPDELIAQYPLANRTDSRLLVYERETHAIHDESFKQLIDYVNPGDLLILNNSKVIPARLYGRKETGGKIEILVERVLKGGACLCHIKSSKAPKENVVLELDNGYKLIVIGRDGGLFQCQLQGDYDLHAVMSDIGHIPLPPYITREDENNDFTRYQTVYAKAKGSVAAPTAGLHFDDALLDSLQAKNVNIDYVTLHVGAGTFQPVRTENLSEHIMHSERVSVAEALCEKIKLTKRQGGKVIAVGTTVVRSLETAALDGELKPYQGETDIFIYPGYEFKVCDAIVTNFHLPESTLLMLIAAFMGHKEVMNMYRHAIDNCYRFFSYGDACLLF